MNGQNKKLDLELLDLIYAEFPVWMKKAGEIIEQILATAEIDDLISILAGIMKEERYDLQELDEIISWIAEERGVSKDTIKKKILEIVG